jgi:VWFA-related protein
MLLAFPALFAYSALAQGSLPPDAFVGRGAISPFDTSRLYNTMLTRQAENDLYPAESPSTSVSKLDLKAPGKARKAYAKGYQLLNRKEYQSAIESLTEALTIYPEFVAAHNALGSSYLGLGQSDKAHDEFAKAVSLDDHLPTSHLNLGLSEFALNNFSAAEADLQKASAIAPLDLHFLSALAYAQLLNHNYEGAVATAHQVHGRKHPDAAIVHFYAAAAWDSQKNLKEEQLELQTLIKEDPHSPAAVQAQEMLLQIAEEQVRKNAPPAETLKTTFEFATAPAPTTPAVVPDQVRKLMQDAKEQQQVTEAEAMCESCAASNSPEAGHPDVSSGPNPGSTAMSHGVAGWTLHRSVDEVAVFFAATDHGKAINDLTQSEVVIRDNRQPPASILGFRGEAQLPLRMGVVIDTSDSITTRFAFEQKAAIDFMQKVLTGKDDLAFVVGVSGSVLLVQDETADKDLLSAGIGKLAPGGGTALWDAVSYAADKLANVSETQPVARILVVISDGNDNSSSASLKEAIQQAERGEVIVYTVSTRDNRDVTTPLVADVSMVGDRALKAVAERTGGTAFLPGSLGYLDRSLRDLQQVIRSRYMVSYRPALFKRDGQYRTIDITAQKSGHKLRIYARKGYYAEAHSAGGGL